MIATLSRLNMALRPAPKVFFNFASLQDQNIAKESLDYQKALLAENIIKMIRQKPKQYNESYSLKDNIVIMIKNSKTSLDAQESLNNLFRHGSSFNSVVFSQVRINDGLAKNDKLVFNPTYLTTGQVFKSVLDSTGISIMQGHFGISKTFSIILLSILTNIINCYKIKNPVLKIAQQLIRVPKLLYWNIDIHTHKKSIIMKNLINQCQEIQKQIKEQQDLNLQQIYLRYSIKMTIIVDQINTLTGQFRKRQAFNEKVRLKLFAVDDPLIDKYYQQKQSIKIRSIIQKAKQIIETLNQIASNFKSIILLSSTCLQNQYLQSESILNQTKHGAGFHKILIEYGLKLNQKGSVMDVIDYFIFQFGERVKLQNFAQKWLNQTGNSALQLKKFIRNSLYQYIQNELKMQFFTNPLYIRKYINQNLANIEKKWSLIDLPNIESEQSEQTLTQKQSILKNRIIQLFNQILEYSNDKFYQKVDQFIKKDNNFSKQIRIGILSLLYEQAIAQNQKADKSNSTLKQITFPKINSRQIPQYLVKPKQVKKTIKSHLDRNILQVNKDYTQIQLMFSSKLIINILHNLRNDFIYYWYMNWHLLITRAKSLSFTGKIFEFSFIKNLTSGDVNLNIKKNSLQKVDYLKIHKISSKQLKFKKWVTSNQRKSKQGQQYSLRDAIKQALTFMINNEIQNAVCTPQTQQKKHSVSNPSIDFIIASINQVTKTIILNAFDITMQQGSGKDKIQKFLQRYENLYDKENTQISIDNVNYQIQLRYYVLDMSEVQINWNLIFNKFMNPQDDSQYQANNQYSFSKSDVKQISQRLDQKFKVYVQSFQITKGKNTKVPLLNKIGQISLDGVEFYGKSSQFLQASSKFLNMKSTLKQKRYRKQLVKSKIKQLDKIAN